MIELSYITVGRVKKCESVQVLVGISKPDSCKIVKQFNLLPLLMLSVSLLASIFLKSKIKTRRIAREVLMVLDVGLDYQNFFTTMTITYCYHNMNQCGSQVFGNGNIKYNPSLL